MQLLDLADLNIIFCIQVCLRVIYTHINFSILGPFGGGNQDWYKFEVAVMVGGGIGVTPYASILNDLVFGTSTNRYSGVACKKVYFLWICPSHRYFEWFIDVLREVEEKDKTNVLEMHIFITQFFHKFDLRTTMLVRDADQNSHILCYNAFNILDLI